MSVANPWLHLVWEDGRGGQCRPPFEGWGGAEKVLSHRSRIDWQPVYCRLESPPRSALSPPSPPPLPPPPVDYGLWVWGSLCLVYFQVSGEDGFRLLNRGFSEFSSPTL